MKKIVLLLAVFMSAITVRAQFSEQMISLLDQYPKVSAGTSTMGSLLYEAISPELSVLRQQYRLELNGNYYGKNGKAFYGETYSLGIKVSGGMLFLDDVVEPWKYDADYKRANADGKYKTEYFWTYQRKLTDSTFQAVELELRSDFTKPLNASKSLWEHQDGNLGLDIDRTTGQKQGFMVWAYASTNVQDSAMAMNLTQSAMSVNARQDTTVALSPDNPSRILGGLFIVPKYSTGGRVQFLLVGVAVKTDATKWALQLLTQGGSTPTVSNGDATPTPSDGTYVPTPSGKKDKKDKKGKKSKK